MTEINKQTFLAELGRLLTFMYEDDRQTALTLYQAIFDDANDEQALVQLLVSPTRQAVLIARAYDSNARKLIGTSQVRETEEEEYPQFLETIDAIRNEALDKGIIFDGYEEELLPEDYAEALTAESAAAAPVIEAAPMESAPVEEHEEIDENQISLFDESPEEEASEPEQSDSPEEGAVAVIGLEGEKQEDGTGNEAPEESAAGEEPEHIESNEEINSFIADFRREVESITGEEQSGEPEEKAAEEPFNIESEAPEAEQAEAEASLEPEPEQADLPELPKEPVATVRKPKIFLLILYIILAIPVTIAGTLLLLIPTLILLSLAAAAVCAGIVCVSAAFSGFAVIADILVVMGLALIVCAIALFLLWTFIWFTVEVLIGFIAAVIRLGKKWCYKEVPAV